MSYTTGRFGPFGGTGAQTIITSLTGAPTGCRVLVGGKNAGDTDTHGSMGTCDGTRQNVQYWFPGGSSTDNASILWIKDNAGTTLFKAAWTSFGTSGASGTVVFNVITNNVSFLPTLEVWN